MLSFATEFPIVERDPIRFVEAVRVWITGSPHTKFTVDSFPDLAADGYATAEVEHERLEAIRTQDGISTIVAFRYKKFDGDLTWVTTVVYSLTELDAWVGVRTFRDSSRAQSSLPPAKKPYVVKTLVSMLGGGLDGELYVRDVPTALSAANISMATRLLNGDADNHLPVVYLSCNFNNQFPIDANALARTLGGVAHILVEPDRDFSRQLQREVESRNVYGGTVGLYWAGGARKVFFMSPDLPHENAVRRAVVEEVRAALMNRRPLLRCTWEAAEATAARSAFEQLRSSGSDKIEDYVQVFDVEMAARAQQLQQAEREIERLSAQVRGAGGHTNSSLLSLQFGSEQELYTGEFTDLIYEILLDARTQVQPGSRREHILGAVTDATSPAGLNKAKREELKRLLRGYTSMDKPTRSGLENLGFSITEEGKHLKMIYAGDDRYVFPLPKSGSDYRGGLNAVSDIGKRLF